MRYRRVTSGLRLLALELLVCAQCLIGQDLLMAHEAIPRTDENSRAAHQQLLAKARQGTIDVYFIGDSITRRWGATDYPHLLANWKKNFHGWNAANFAWGGDTTQNILWRLQNGELDGVSPKLFVIQAGTNNLPWSGPAKAEKVDEVASGIRAILELLQVKCPEATIVLTGVFPRTQNMDVKSTIQQINRRLATLAETRHVRFLNINDKLGHADGRLRQGMSSDGLHLELQGYEVWAGALKPILAEILGPPKSEDHAPPATGDPKATSEDNGTQQLKAAQSSDDGLKHHAAGRFLIGVGVSAGIIDRPEDWPLLKRNFEIVTPENCMKPQGVQAVEGEFRFDRCDAFVNFATDHQLQVVGHCLVWAKDDRTPEWWLTENGQPTSKEKLLERMESHIDAVVGRYGDRIAMWDVVNEALADGNAGYLRDSVWTRTTGEEFIVRAFQYARKKAPDALLIYNDYRCDTPGKRDKLIRLMKSLKSQDTPVDAVGLQGHYEIDSVPFAGLEAMFQAMRELDVKVVVSELDLDVVRRGRWWADGNKYREELKSFDPYKDGCPQEVLARQADQYAKLFELFCKYDDVIERVSFWNLHDGQSWLNYFPWNRVNHPLLFDRDGNPKPAYAAVTAVLDRYAESPANTDRQ
jgi:endo-1,4-beta-xylanase